MGKHHLVVAPPHVPKQRFFPPPPFLAVTMVCTHCGATVPISKDMLTRLTVEKDTILNELEKDAHFQRWVNCTRDPNG